MALCMIGQLMSDKKDHREWRTTKELWKKSKLHQITSMHQHFFKRLQEGYYNNMADEMKQRFLLCSLWPGNENISMEDLIWWWIGLGLLDVSNANDTGYTIINGFESASMLEKAAINALPLELERLSNLKPTIDLPMFGYTVQTIADIKQLGMLKWLLSVLTKLRELSIIASSHSKVLVAEGGSSYEDWLLPYLEIFELNNMFKLEKVTRKNAGMDIRVVSIYKCDKLKDVLEQLTIAQCQEMERLIENGESLYAPIIFPRLKRLKLEELPKLSTTYKKAWDFEELSYIYVAQCSEMKNIQNQTVDCKGLQDGGIVWRYGGVGKVDASVPVLKMDRRGVKDACNWQFISSCAWKDLLATWVVYHKKIAAQCGDFSLTLCVLGRAMSNRRDPREWKSACGLLMAIGIGPCEIDEKIGTIIADSLYRWREGTIHPTKQIQAKTVVGQDAELPAELISAKTPAGQKELTLPAERI
ncbi:hypothetical protein VPH35_063692 [Triticum aestivum]